MSKTEIKTIRCAVYTRKSTNEGVDQDFTSLDNQRESAENYIASQKSQGWVTVPEKYDDFGYTGANMERPALERLLEDVKSGKVNCVVVYKVDRLSRSLLDFTSLLNMFEQHNVTFVSITQHFNTNSSMGRLTLNILLSFAQFEREIISERTRDKIAGARKRGKFTGGRPALGYDYDFKDKKLIVNPKEAALVKQIFKTYIHERSLLTTSIKLNVAGHKTKVWLRNGKPAGGVAFTKLNLDYILRNVLYTGKVRYKDEIFSGEHSPIISEDLFNTVREIREGNQRKKQKQWARTGGGLFSKMLRCERCDAAMVYNYSYKKNYKYRYYMCHRVTKMGFASCPTKTVAAQNCENIILDCLQKICDEPRFKPETWSTLSGDDQREIMRSLVQVINYDAVDPTLKIKLIDDPQEHVFKVDLKPSRVYKPRMEATPPKHPQVRLMLLLAHQIQAMVNEGKDLKTIANWLNMNYSRICQVVNLLVLAPAVQEEIICSDDQRLFQVPEYRLREIFNELDWACQLKNWQNLLDQYPAAQPSIA